MTPMTQPGENEMGEESDSWRCFHCDEVFTTTETARIHFGDCDGQTPLCVEAANADISTLIRTNRELWDRVQQAESEAETAQFCLGNFEYTARKLTGKASASTSDLVMAWDCMEGEVKAAEAAIKAAPRWLANLLRWTAERRWMAHRTRMNRLTMAATAIRKPHP